MFSKAKVKRFNEEVGCAPPPTAYEPKNVDNKGISIDRSQRWRENKEITPAPNAYSLGCEINSTPIRLNRHHRSLTRTKSSLSCSSNTSTPSNSSSLSCTRNEFLSPKTPRLARRSVQSNTLEEMTNTVLRLRREKEDVQKSLLILQSKLTELTSTKTSVDQEVQTELSNHKEEEDIDFLKEEIEHLTKLRNNLEQSSSKKDHLIQQLRSEYEELEEFSHNIHSKIDICYKQLLLLRNQLRSEGTNLILLDAITQFLDCYEATFKNDSLVENMTLDELAKASLEAEVSSLQTRVEEAEAVISLLRDETRGKDEAERELGQVNRLLGDAQELQLFLQKEIDIKEQEVSASHSKLSAVTDEYSQTRECLVSIQEVNDGLREELEKLQATLQEKEELIERMAQEISWHQLTMSSLENKVSSLTAENMEATHDHEMRSKKQETQIQELNQKIKEVEEEHLCVALKLSTLENTSTESRETVEVLQNKMVQMTGELEASEANYKKRMESSERELLELAEQHSEALLEHEATRAALRGACEKLEVVEGAHGDCDDHIRELQDKIKSQSMDIIQKLKRCSDLEVDLELLTARLQELSTLTEDSEVLVTTLKTQLSDARGDKEELASELKKQTSTTEGFVTQIQQLRQDMAKKSDALEETKQALDVMREEKNCLNQQLSVTAREMQSVREENDARVGTMRAENERQVDAVIGEKDRELRKVREEHVNALSTLKTENERMFARAQEEEERTKDLEEQLSNYKQREETWLLQRAEHQQKGETLNNELAKSETEKTSLVKKLEGAKAEYTTLEQQLQESTLKNSTLEQQNIEMEQRMKKLEAEHARDMRDKQKKLTDAFNERMAEAREKNIALEKTMKEVAENNIKLEDENKELHELMQQLTEVEESLVGPLTEQLEAYESDRLALLSSESAARKNAEEMSERYAKLIGHQNHRQKIQHVDKLKNDKLKLTEENAKLRAEVEKYRKICSHSATGSRTKVSAKVCGGKENLPTPSAKSKMPLGASNSNS